MELREYDVVISKRKLSENVPEGSLGTVLIIHDPSVAYEVEFMEAGRSLDVLTVKDEDLIFVERYGPKTE
ncbi:MAG: DUF4926 domain-containing protein [Pyrinomonadaceae bacterium]